MNHANLLVLGGTGFVGRHLVAALAARGLSVRVATRRLDRASSLRLLPTVEIVEADPHDPSALAALLAGCDAVINLVGVLHSRPALSRKADSAAGSRTADSAAGSRKADSAAGGDAYGEDFRQAHVELPRSLLAACRAAGVKRVLQMSALGADRAGPSEYLRSKGEGEALMLAASDLEVTVFRPSVIFGPDDRFLNLFARLAAVLPVLLVGSPETRFQPVYVGDVVRAMLAALDRRESHGQGYSLCGPRQYTLRELVQFACAASGRRLLIIGLPARLSYLQAWALELLPVKLLTRDNYRSMQKPSVCQDGEPMPFGIRPVALEDAAPAWLKRGPR